MNDDGRVRRTPNAEARVAKEETNKAAAAEANFMVLGEMVDRLA
jgi:hypothetical protein